MLQLSLNVGHSIIQIGIRKGYFTRHHGYEADRERTAEFSILSLESMAFRTVRFRLLRLLKFNLWVSCVALVSHLAPINLARVGIFLSPRHLALTSSHNLATLMYAH